MEHSRLRDTRSSPAWKAFSVSRFFADRESSTGPAGVGPVSLLVVPEMQE
jgi:hypothetical protein